MLENCGNQIPQKEKRRTFIVKEIFLATNSWVRKENYRGEGKMLAIIKFTKNGDKIKWKEILALKRRKRVNRSKVEARNGEKCKTVIQS